MTWVPAAAKAGNRVWLAKQLPPALSPYVSVAFSHGAALTISLYIKIQCMERAWPDIFASWTSRVRVPSPVHYMTKSQESQKERRPPNCASAARLEVRPVETNRL